MTVDAPSSFNQDIFFDANSVFYGTDDGYQDGSFTEFRLFETFYEGVDSRRWENIHFVSAVGGLYGLNLIPLLRPKEITFFDINFYATAYFEVVRKVFAVSSSREDFLRRLSHQEYDADSPREELIRENLALKMEGRLPRSRGSSYKRSLEVSWQYALDHFDLTRGLLADTPLQVRTEGIESESFCDFVRNAENVWMFCSNIVEFTFSGLRFDHPGNAVMISLVYPGQVELLDLSPFADRPVEVRFEIPLRASVVGEQLIPDDGPPSGADEMGERLAGFCRDQLELPPDGRILDVGSDWGQLAIALDAYLDQGGEYEGFDPQREHVLWAKENLMPVHDSCAFHIANIRNNLYNPNGSLDPTTFRFPYDDGRFDVVVAHSLFPCMLPAEFEHYVAEISRVLKAGGHFFSSFFLIDDETRQGIASRAGPHCFRYPAGNITTSGPNRGGLAAYDEGYVRDVIVGSGIEIARSIRGTWRGYIDTGFEEDVVIGRKPSSGGL
jgi:SAM-dependent methyltransferase